MSEIEENVKPRFSVPIPIKLPVPLARPITAGNGGDLHDLDALSGGICLIIYLIYLSNYITNCKYYYL